MRGECRVVTAAVLCVNNQAAVEQLSLVVGERAVRTDKAQDVFGRGQLGVGLVQEHRLALEVAAACLVGVGDDDRELGHQTDALTQDVLGRDIVRGGVVGVEREGCACELVHDVRAGRTHNHVLGEVVGQGTRLTDHCSEEAELLAGGQTAGQQQVADLAKAEAVLVLEGVEQVVQIDAAIGQLALDGFALTFVEQVAMNVTKTGDTGHNACAVRVSQAALDIVL